MDLNHFVTFKLNTILFNHINDFIKCYENNLELLRDLNTLKVRIAKQHELVKLVFEQSDRKPHFTLKSRRHELVYLRQICKQILPFLLPENVFKCK